MQSFSTILIQKTYIVICLNHEMPAETAKTTVVREFGGADVIGTIQTLGETFTAAVVRWSGFRSATDPRSGTLA